MTFQAIIDAATLSDALETVSALVGECKIRLDEDGLGIRAVDAANVAMADMSLDNDAFESYESTEGVIGVNLTRLEDVVDMADSGQLVEFELDEETRKLHIQIEGLEYTLALIDPSSIRQEPDIPDLNLPARVVVEGRDITRAVKAADMVSDHIRFGVDEDDEQFHVEAAGDTDSVDLALDQDDVIDLTTGPANSLFSLDYLDDMAGAIPAGSEVTIDLGEEIPVKLHFELADGDADVTYMLAPRIDSNSGGGR